MSFQISGWVYCLSRATVHLIHVQWLYLMSQVIRILLKTLFAVCPMLPISFTLLLTFMCLGFWISLCCSQYGTFQCLQSKVSLDFFMLLTVWYVSVPSVKSFSRLLKPWYLLIWSAWLYRELNSRTRHGISSYTFPYNLLPRSVRAFFEALVPGKNCDKDLVILALDQYGNNVPCMIRFLLHIAYPNFLFARNLLYLNSNLS